MTVNENKYLIFHSFSGSHDLTVRKSPGVQMLRLKWAKGLIPRWLTRVQSEVVVEQKTLALFSVDISITPGVYV